MTKPARRRTRPGFRAFGVRRHALIGLVMIVAFSVSGCARPCPEGVFEGGLWVEDDTYFVPGGFGGLSALGAIGQSGIEECRQIHGGLVFNGNVSDFSDFDALEYVSGSISFRELGYPEGVVAGQTREVVEGFQNLERVDGAVTGGQSLLGMSSLRHVGKLTMPSIALFSLQTVAGDLSGVGHNGSLSHLLALETVGGNFVTSAGDFGELVSLRAVSGDLTISYAEAVTFTPPSLEEVGGDVTIWQNDNIFDAFVPALRWIGGRLTVVGNFTPDPTVPRRVRSAFIAVDVGNGGFICGNGPEDPCPRSDDCTDYFDDVYCCTELTTEECALASTWREAP